MTDNEGPRPSSSDRPALADQRDVDTVYGAAEDSHLLAQAALEEIRPGDRAIDVGTGSGYVAAALAEAGARVVGTDLNPSACRRTAARGLPVVRGNVLDPIQADTANLVACNPPYLPTDPDMEWGDWMEAALSGGEDGRAMIDPFLADVGRVLRNDGVGFLLVSSLTGIDAVRAFARDHDLESRIVAEDTFPFERLVVLGLQHRE